MRVKFEQISAHLARKGLAPVYCLAGDEPLQLIECADAIRQHARTQGYSERAILHAAKGFDWNILFQQTANLSLFASRRIIDLRLFGSGPGKDGSEALTEYCAAPPADDLLLMSCDKLDKKAQQSKWFKALDGAGVTVLIYPVEPARLPAWIAARFARHGRKLEPGAAELIALRVEGNLLAASQELEKLLLLVEKDTISVNDAMQSISDSARFDVFAMVESCLSGDGERALRMLRGLRSEGAVIPELLGAVLWELRHVCGVAFDIAAGVPRERSYSAHRIWPQRRAAIEAALKRYTPPMLAGFLREAALVDRAGKGALDFDAWQLLENLLLRLAGVRLTPPPVANV